jgi:hypothetical protein
MVAVCANQEEIIDASSSTARPNQLLRSMRRTDEAQTVQGSAGKHEHVLSSQILRPELHGDGNDRNHQGHEREELSSSVSTDGQGNVRGMRVPQIAAQFIAAAMGQRP